MRVGIDAQWLLPDAGAGGVLQTVAREIVDAGLDVANLGDHVSFRNGTGFDGLINATAVLASHPHIAVQVGVYLLPARHPILVARQLASISALAPGRLTLAVGVGGEDRNEMAMLGVDPATRGRRIDEALPLLRRLLTGESVDHDGEFYAFAGACIQPPPYPPVPLLVGGRSDAALRRAARHGDGWHAIWVSPQRYRAALEQIEEMAVAAGRQQPPTDHALNVWCGFDDAGRSGADRLRTTMEGLYGLPFERFQKWCPSGTPEDIAAAIAPYRDAGCKTVVVIPAGLPGRRAVELTGEVRRHLS